MYPSALVSRPRLIDYHADDTEMFLHLDKMMNGAPHPQNVLTDVDVDPYAVAPWNLPPNMLYFINSDQDIKGEKGIKATEGGYWFSKTWTQSPTMGRVTTKEFYGGQPPRGEKTVWVMKEYTMDKFLGSSSLCKVFKHNNGNHSEERQQAVADDADGDFVKAMLLRMLEHEENISGFQSSSNMSQVEVVSRNRHGPPVISGSHLQNLRPPNYVWDPDEYDFLEEKDLVGSASSSSSSSENTWVSSMTLNDEYFDPDALLRELTPSIEDTTNKQNVDCCRATGSASLGAHQIHFQPPPSGESVNKQNVDRCRATGSASLGAHQVHFQRPPSGSLGGSGSTSSSNNKNPLRMKTVVSASVPSIHIGGLNHTHPPTAASIEELPNKKIVGRITKFAKKYLCFM